MNSINSDIRFPSRSNRAVVALVGVAVVAFAIAFAVSFLPFVASAHTATFVGVSGTSTTTAPGASIPVSVSVNLDSGDSVKGILWWFDSNSNPTDTAVPQGASCANVPNFTNTTDHHVSDATDSAFSVTAPSTNGNYTFYYAITDSSHCNGNVGSVQSDPVLTVVVQTPQPAPAACSTGPTSVTSVVDVQQQITNDPDSGFHGNWALDTFTRHIQIWKDAGAANAYCAQSTDSGHFVTTGPNSPGNSGGPDLPLNAGITGTMVGGSGVVVVTGAFSDSGTWGTSGTITSPDCSVAGACDGLTGKWMSNYFPGGTFSYPNWSWTYTADCSTHGAWTNSNTSIGDILAGADCSVVTAKSQSVATLENTAVTITLAGTDSVSANTLVFATSSNPTSGTLATTSSGAVFAYTPNTGFTGNDSFTFTAGDGMATSTGTVTIAVNAPASGGGNGGSAPAATTQDFGGGGTVVGLIGSVNTNPTGSSSNGGQVLGASTDLPASCSIYLSGYFKKGSTDTAGIKKLQAFLNQNLGLSIPVTGVFGPMTEAAVEQFQTKYSDDILKPWFTQGLSKDMQPSGYVYKTTLRMINLLQCSSLAIPQPQLP